MASCLAAALAFISKRWRRALAVWLRMFGDVLGPWGWGRIYFFRVPSFGVLRIRILAFRVPYFGVLAIRILLF